MTETIDPRRQEILSIISDRSGRVATEESSLGELAMDSLDNVELAMAIEDHYPDRALVIDDDIWNFDTTAAEVIDNVIAMLDA